MAKDLGFFVIETERQFVMPSVDEADVVELRQELGFMDLVRTSEADEGITRRLTKTLPTYAVERADKWRSTALSGVADQFETLRTVAHAQLRHVEIEVLRSLSQTELDVAGGW